ncbi:uncharacterized protein BX663DRAFT_524617 [Cokeromyces recurvatus]|uniref:uncharacterized protein n=1 Tax=Cokeromyces recurvatus TaxID=90255 RepID=UPI00221E8B32|nr:uncharacterized protein BX663DRAFT_524617 [Cokeromyces recurvatus]KAI7898566.1 hypothetical protein BX663DRAFT_524617 [Cokeromyces recurvatus]
MVSIKAVLTCSLITLLSAQCIHAAIAPTYPQPGTIQTEGQTYDVTWDFDGKDPEVTYRIDFMTGSNDQQTVLMNVATGVPANLLKYPFKVPQVSPHSAIYFFMFTGTNGEMAWTTRFGIIPPGGTLSPEPNRNEPNGDPIPWGNGTLVNNVSIDTNVNATHSLNASVSVSASAIVTATSTSTTTITTPTVDTTTVPVSSSDAAAVAITTATTTSTAKTTTVNMNASTTSMASNQDVADSAANMIKPLFTSLTLLVVAYLFVL